jgi:hypothetical protein
MKMRMRSKISGTAFLVLIGVGVLMAVNFYNMAVYPLEIAKAEVNNAQSAGYPAEMIEKLNKAKGILTNNYGNPRWMWATGFTNWDDIKTDLNQNIQRLDKLKPLDDKDPALQQGLDDVRGKLRVIADRIAAAEDWVWVSSTNIEWAILLAIVEIILVRLFFTD